MFNWMPFSHAAMPNAWRYPLGVAFIPEESRFLHDRFDFAISGHPRPRPKWKMRFCWGDCSRSPCTKIEHINQRGWKRAPTGKRPFFSSLGFRMSTCLAENRPVVRLRQGLRRYGNQYSKERNKTFRIWRGCFSAAVRKAPRSLAERYLRCPSVSN